MRQPKAIVSFTRSHFLLTCEENGWNPYSIEYVNFRHAQEKLCGYRPEDIYPPPYGTFDINKGDK